MAERPSGLRVPTKIGKGIPKPASTPTGISSDHGLCIGDKVLVSGSKSGSVQFLGETKFAPGEWAGIVLEKKEGKNDGSVAGVRYFQCEPLHGIFARPHKLLKDASAKTSSSEKKIESGDSGGVKTAPLTAASLKALEGPKESKIKQPSKLRSPASSIRSLRLGTSRQPAQTNAAPNFSIGDRVVVNGTKYGFARYIGETDFAKGNWVGVELDGPQGKNDGSVLGKRYFTCEMLFGLFAPLSKVKKVVPDTPKQAGARHIGKETSLSAVKKSTATGIQSPSSVASVGSTSSLSGLSKSKGMKSEVSSRYERKTMSSGTSALQEALKEKQQHVESLMAERDIERSDMMQAIQEAAELRKAIEETKVQFAQQMVEKESELDALKDLVERADVDKVSLRQAVEEQKTIVGDLQFRLEEEKINKDDLQSEITGVQEKIREMEVSLNIEQNRSQVLQRDLENARALGVDDKSELETLRQERDRSVEIVKELSARLDEADRLQQEVVASEVVDALEDRISELLQEIEKLKIDSEEDAKTSEKNILELQKTTNEKMELKSDLDQTRATLQELTDKNSTTQLLLDEATANADEKQNKLEDFQKQIEQLLSNKSALEEENRKIVEMSGDSSSQLNALMESLQKKDRLIEQLQSDIRTATASCKELEVQKRSCETELTKLKASQEASDHQLEDFGNKLSSAQSIVEELHTKLKEGVAAHDELLMTLTNVNTEKLTVESQLEELRKKYTEIEESLHSTQEERNSLEEKFKNVTTEFSALHERCESVQVQCTSTEKEKQHLSETCHNQLIQISELSESQEKYKSQYEEAKTTLTQLCEQAGDEKGILLQQLEEFREISERQVVQLAEGTKQIENLLQEKSAIEQEKDAIKNSLNQAEETVKSFKEDLVSCRKEKDDMEKEFNDKRNAFQELSSQLENSMASLKEIQSELEEKNGKLEHENKELLGIKESLQDDLIKANNRVENTCVTLLETEEKYNTLKGENTGVKKQLEDSILQYQNEVDRCKELDLVVRNLGTEKFSLQQKIDLMSAEQGTVKEESFQLLDKIKDLEVCKTQLESDVSKNLDEIMKLKNEIEAVNREKLLVDNSLSDVTSELQLTNENLKTKCTMLEEQGKAKGELQLQLEESRTIIHTRKKEVDESLFRISTFQSEISDLKSKLQVALSSDEEQQSKISSLVEELSISQEEKIRLQLENVELEKVKQEYSHKITSLNSENQDIQKQLLESNEEFKKSTESVQKEAEEKIQQMQNEMDELTKSLQHEKDSLDSLKEKNQDVINDLRSAKESAKCVSDELAKKCEESEALSVEIQNLRNSDEKHLDKQHSLEKELNEVKEESIKERSNLKQQYDGEKQRADDLEEILKEKEKKISDNLSDISNLQSENSDLKSKLQVSTFSDTEQQQKIASLLEEVGILQEGKNSLLQLKLELEKVKQEYSDKIASLNDEKNVMQKQLLDSNEIFKNSTETIQLKAEENIQRMLLEMEELRKSLRNEKDAGEQTKEMLENLEEKNKEILANLESAKTSESNIKVELMKKCDGDEAMLSEMQTLRENMEMYKEQAVTLEKQLNETKVDSMEKSTLQQRLDSMLQTQNQLIEERDCVKQGLGELEQVLAGKEKAENEHRSRIIVLEADISNSKEDYCKLDEELKLLTDAHNKLKSQQMKMEKSDMDIGERETVLKSEFSKERVSLQQTIDITTALIEKKQEENEQCRQEIVVLKKENASVLTLQESLRTLEKEKDLLQKELNSMKSSPVAGSSSTVDSGMGADDEQRGQVDFLNSVIVDQQNKIKELSDKISELEAMLLNGEDVDEREIYTEFDESEQRKRYTAPRLFCDICDIFDAHDTEDCPTQSMVDDVTSLPQTVHNAVQGEERSYCDYCEVFGHWTEECTQEEEMY